MPAVRNGTGQRYTTTMGYDTGSNMLTIFQHELFVLFTLTGIQALRWVPVNVAGGQVLSRQCDVDMRILSEDESQLLLNTHTVTATVVMDGSRLSSDSLQQHTFVCTHPRTRRVYISKNKTQLLRLMPA